MAENFTVDLEEVDKIYAASGVDFREIKNFILDPAYLGKGRNKHKGLTAKEVADLRRKSICSVCRGIVRIPRIVQCLSCLSVFCEACIDKIHARTGTITEVESLVSRDSVSLFKCPNELCKQEI